MAKGINIFDSAKGKPKPSSSAKDKPTVEVDGIEGQLNELQNLKNQIANLETQLDVVTDEIKTIAKEKFVELYLENGRNPNTFLLKDGSGCVMVIPTDKYISIKDEDRANQLIETYGEDIVTIDEKYYFNPEVLERNMKAIEKLIRDAKGISDADKQNLLIREVKYSVTKGTIDELADYGEDMESVINDIQPIITLKNCGGKMAEGGTDGEFIANIYESGGMMADGGMSEYFTQNEKYDLLYNFVDEKMIEGDEVAERIINGELPNGYNDLYDYVDEKMVEGDSKAAELLNVINNLYATKYKYAKGGKVELIVHGKSRQYSLGKFNSAKEAKKYVEESDLKQPYSIKKLEDGGVMMAHGGMKKVLNKNNVEYRVNIVPTGDWTDTYNLSVDMYSDEYGGSTHSVMKILSKSEAERMFNKANESNIEDMYRIFAKKPTHKNKKFANGGFFGNSRYNTGRSWHLDHARHNKKESYEKPLNKRKRRFKK